MGPENFSEDTAPPMHNIADLKHLGEHQQSLRLFMESWLTQHDQILQAITNTVQTQNDATPQALQSEEPWALGPQAIHPDGSLQSVPCDRVQMTHKDKGTSNTSDMLVSVRRPHMVHDVFQACTGGVSSTISNKIGILPTAYRDAHVSSASLVNQGMAKLVSSPWFECLCSTIIIANAVVIAYSADYTAQNLDKSKRPILEGVEMGLATFYIGEWVLRLVAFRLYFFFAPDKLWNIFDTLLVVSAAHDLIMYLSNSGKAAASSVVFLRIVRVMKMLKLLRIVRILRLFRELRLIASLIRASLKPLVWAVVLLAIISYIIGICFLQAGTSYLQKNDRSQKEVDAIGRHWGSVWKAMTSLYMASTNGDSWRAMAEALIPIGYSYYFLFLLYIAFFLFVVMNTLTSLFLEAVIQKAEKDTKSLIREELERMNDYFARAAELFRKMDEDGSGNVTEAEFLKYANNADMAALASSLELDVSDMAQFYKMLSCRGKYAVDVGTFALGCMKLKGPAKSMDLQMLIASQKRAARTLEDVSAATQSTAVLVQRILSMHQATTRPSESATQSESALACIAPTAGKVDSRKSL